MNKLVLHSVAFLSGFSLMGYEILGSRILAPYFGSSVYIWGGLISVFMFGMSIGYMLGGRLADRHNSPIELSIIFIISAIFIFLSSFYGKIVCNKLLSLSFDVKYTALIASLILFTIPSTCLGATSPYLIRLYTPDSNNIGKKSGSIFAAATSGSIIGTLFVSFYLILLTGTGTGIKLLCIPLVISFFLLFFKRKKLHIQE